MNITLIYSRKISFFISINEIIWNLYAGISASHIAHRTSQIVLHRILRIHSISRHKFFIKWFLCLNFFIERFILCPFLWATDKQIIISLVIYISLAQLMITSCLRLCIFFSVFTLSFEFWIEEQEKDRRSEETMFQLDEFSMKHRQICELLYFYFIQNNSCFEKKCLVFNEIFSFD